MLACTYFSPTPLKEDVKNDATTSRDLTPVRRKKHVWQRTKKALVFEFMAIKEEEREEWFKSIALGNELILCSSAFERPTIKKKKMEEGVNGSFRYPRARKFDWPPRLLFAI